MAEDKQSIKRRVLLNLFGHWSVVAPFVGGVSALAVPMASGHGDPWLTWAGIIGVLASAGSLATRWLFQLDDLTKEAWDELNKSRVDEREKRLDELERRLEVDGDPRTETLLRRLRRAEEDLQSRGLAGNVDRASRVEISFQASELVGQCLEAFEASLALRARSREMFGPNRDAVEARRHEEIAEIAACVEVLENLAINGVAGSSDAKGRLGELRRELDQSLEVARRVEERMKSLDSRIPGEAERGSYAE